MSNDVSAPLCPHCGANQINHQAARLEVTLELFLDRLFYPVEFLRKGLEHGVAWLRFDQLIPPIVDALAAVGLASKIIEPVPGDSYRTKVLWEAARKRKITMYKVGVLGKPTSMYIASCNKRRIVFIHMPRPEGPMSDSYNWMDNKSVMIDKFKAAGIPVPRGGDCRSERDALRIFDELAGPAITKPILGSRSRHTTIHIVTREQLLRGFAIAKQISPWVIVEEELQGMVYRVTIIGGRVAGVLRREPPHVIGDGVHTVEQLVAGENENPKRQGPIFHHITLGSDAEEELRRQKLNLASVPASGQFVSLNQKVGRGEGASNADVTDEVHPENIKLFEKIGTFLADPLVGIDFIINDMGAPWYHQRACGVIECNAMPFIDLHHYPLTGQVRDAAGALWDIVFPEAKQKPLR
jgi:D-alanine-D-alanine ligase-like ATP-grasp enzyme